MDLQLVGSGPSDNDIDWTHRFFEKMYSGRRDDVSGFMGWSVHHYSSGKNALEYNQEEWYKLLSEAALVDTIITDQWATMGQYDRDHKVKLVVDEYGPWYREGTELDPTHIFGQQITLRDALATALTLDSFNRHADKVAIGTCAQLVNNLNALFLAHEEHFIETPNFHVFDMYAGHQGAQAVTAHFSAAEIPIADNGKRGSIWAINGSASRTGNRVKLTFVNSDFEKQRTVQIGLRGASPASASGRVLAAQDVHSHNTFEQPDTVRSAPINVPITSGVAHVTAPPGSVLSIDIVLA